MTANQTGKKHRKLVVRNTLTELESAIYFLKQQGWEIDPDWESESLKEAIQTVMDRKQAVTCGMFKIEYNR